MGTEEITGHEVSGLPYAVGSHAPIEGHVRERPEDFRVEELPAYVPSGAGDHLFVRFEKTGLGTPEAVRRISGALGVEPREAGYAGLKDRHAITTQWASFLFGDAARLPPELDGVRVLEAARHGNKLRTGHLRGNRFDLLVRGAPADRASDARETLTALAERGAPNYFGEQRFGRDAGNLAAARRWLIEGGRPPRGAFERKLFVSALQSAIFNELLAERVRERSYDDALLGDLARKEDSGGLFIVEDAEDGHARARAFEISATGPMFGDRMRPAEGEIGAREDAALARSGLTAAVLARVRRAGPGARRPYRTRVQDPSLEVTQDGLRIAFTLPAGAYATVVLRELLRRPVTD